MLVHAKQEDGTNPYNTSPKRVRKEKAVKVTR